MDLSWGARQLKSKFDDLTRQVFKDDMWSFVTLLTTSNLERPPFRRRTDAPTAGAAWEFAQGTCQKETLQVHSSAVPGPFSTDRVPLHARLCGLPDAVPTTFGYAVVVELWRPKVRLREGPPYLGAPSRPVLDFRPMFDRII